MTVAADDVLRIVAQFLWSDGNINQNVFAAQVSGGSPPYSDSDIVDDAEAWLDNLYANIVTNMSDEIDGNLVTVYKWDSVGGDWDEVGSQAWTFNPTQSNEFLPKAVAAQINMGTTDPDVQGKKYIPGYTEAESADGLWGSGALVNLLAFAIDWYTGFTGGTSGATWTPGVWSVVAEAFLAAIDSATIPAIPAYQRRRKRNVGI